MGTETYPKKSHTVGEQTTSTNFRVPSSKGKAPAADPGATVRSKTSYPAKGHAGPSSRHVSRETSRAPYAKASKSALHSVSYPAKGHAKFPSERARNVLEVPTSEMPHHEGAEGRERNS